MVIAITNENDATVWYNVVCIDCIYFNRRQMKLIVLYVDRQLHGEMGKQDNVLYRQRVRTGNLGQHWHAPEWNVLSCASENKPRQVSLGGGDGGYY